MTDFHGDTHRECVTHHACDCIQERLRKAGAELREYREALERVVIAVDGWQLDRDGLEDWDSVDYDPFREAVAFARSALSSSAAPCETEGEE